MPRNRLILRPLLMVIPEIAGIIFGVALIAHPYVSDYLEKQYRS